MARLWWMVCFLVSLKAFAEQPFYITFPSDVDWVTRSSEHFDLLYRRGEEKLALRTIGAAEKAFRLLNPIFPEGPKRTWLVLADFHDAINGYAITFPWPHMVIFAAPPTGSDQLSSLDDWLDTVVLHENVHVRHIFPANGLWAPARSIFGSIISPNAFMPSHFHEGLAVLMETELTTGGRGKSSYFSMLRRVAVDEGVWGNKFLAMDQMDGGLTTWPQGTSAYFFGYQMTKELWNRRGAKGIYDWVLSSSSNWPYLQDIPLGDAYHTDYSTLWKSIFYKTGEEEKNTIAEIKKSPLSELSYITQSRYTKSDVTLSPDGKQIAYLQSTPEEGGKLEVMDLATQKIVRSFDFRNGGGEGFCWVQNKEREGIFALESMTKNGYQLNHLKYFDIRADEKVEIKIEGGDELIHMFRLSCDVSRERFLIYRDVSGRGRVQELLAKFNEMDKDKHWQLVLKREWYLPYKSWVTSLVAGKTSWIALRRGARTHIYRWSESGPPTEVTEVPYNLFDLRVSGNQKLLAVANFDGRDEVWELDLKEAVRRKKVGLLGGANGFDYRESTNEFILSSYRHGGYDIALAKPINGESAALEVPPTFHDEPIPEEAPSGVSEPKEYSPIETLLPHAWIPNILLVPNGAQIGAWIPGFDISQRHAYNFIGGYDTRGLPFADLTYTYRFGTAAALNTEAYFLPNYIYQTGTFFTQWGATAAVSNNFDFFPPLTLSAGPIFARTEASVLGPETQSVGLQATATLKLWFRRRPISISYISGTRLSISQQQFLRALGSDENYYATVLGWDQYVEAPWWREHVFSLVARFGITEGSPFFNYFFQSGGELLFAQYRGSFINRGFQPGTFIGRQLLNTNLEYRFPIARIERGVALWPATLESIHMALVSDMTTYDRYFGGPLDVGTDSQLFRVFYLSAGAELRTEWNFLFYVPTQVRFGFYHGFGPLGTPLYFNCGIDAEL